MTLEDPPWRFEVRRGLTRATDAEKELIEAAHRGNVTGASWWRLLEETFEGTRFLNVHVFFYRGASAAEPPCAQYSAQYFPALPLGPHLSLPRPLDRVLRAAGVPPLRARCLVVHSLSSVQSVAFRPADAEPFARGLARSLARLRKRHPFSIALVRSLDARTASALEGPLVRLGWSFLPGRPCNRYRLARGEACLEEYLARFRHKRRWELKKSMRRLGADGRVRTLRVRTPEELAPYVPQILEIKEETLRRKKEAIPIPLHERPEFFTRCLQAYGENAFFLLLVRDGGHLLGYNLTVAAGDRARGISLCVRHPEGKAVDAWFNLSLAMLDALSRAGVREVNVGLGDDEVKAKLGAQAEDLCSAVTFRPALSRLVLNRLLLPRIRRI